MQMVLVIAACLIGSTFARSRILKNFEMPANVEKKGNARGGTRGKPLIGADSRFASTSQKEKKGNFLKVMKTGLNVAAKVTQGVATVTNAVNDVSTGEAFRKAAKKSEENQKAFHRGKVAAGNAAMAGGAPPPAAEEEDPDPMRHLSAIRAGTASHKDVGEVHNHLRDIQITQNNANAELDAQETSLINALNAGDKARQRKLDDQKKRNKEIINQMTADDKPECPECPAGAEAPAAGAEAPAADAASTAEVSAKDSAALKDSGAGVAAKPAASATTTSAAGQIPQPKEAAVQAVQTAAGASTHSLSDPVDFPPLGVGTPPAGKGQFIPWGKHIPRKSGINYYVATGVQECDLCKRVALNMRIAGANMYDLCNGEYPEYQDMCHAQQQVLQACPEAINDWCYEDLGGTQVLRSPCPTHLKCHYCLGLNPLHCADQPGATVFVA
jgi:hypothetical protein